MNTYETSRMLRRARPYRISTKDALWNKPLIRAHRDAGIPTLDTKICEQEMEEYKASFCEAQALKFYPHLDFTISNKKIVGIFTVPFCFGAFVYGLLSMMQVLLVWQIILPVVLVSALTILAKVYINDSRVNDKNKQDRARDNERARLLKYAKWVETDLADYEGEVPQQVLLDARELLMRTGYQAKISIIYFDEDPYAVAKLGSEKIYFGKWILPPT